MVLFNIPFDEKGIFLNRKNRFLAEVELKGEKILAHIHDPGRLKELLYLGNSVYLKRQNKPHRKTKWDIIAAKKNKELVFIHSGYHSILADKIISSPYFPFGEILNKKSEVKYNSHRYDFLLSLKDNSILWLEVKGCTLEIDGISLFPDAPTKRGQKHLEGLIKLKKEGYKCSVMFLIFVKSTCFMPNKKQDPVFYSLFLKAINTGVNMHCFYLQYDGKDINFIEKVPLCL